MPSAQSVPAGLGVLASRSSASAASSVFAAAGGRLDQLGQRPRGHAEPGMSSAGPLGPRPAPPRSGRGRCRAPRSPSRAYGHRDALPPAVGLRDGGLDQRAAASASRPRQRGEQQRGVRRTRRPGRLGDRVGLGDQRRGRGEVAAPARPCASDGQRRAAARSSAPASRASWTCRVAERVASRRRPTGRWRPPRRSQPQRSASSAGCLAARKALHGAAAAPAPPRRSPSVTSSARPSSSRSIARGGSRAAGSGRGRRGRPPAGPRRPPRRPANSAAASASR